MKYPLIIVGLITVALSSIYILRDPAPQVFHSDFVGSEVCGDCHWINYDAWKISPHHNIARQPMQESVVDDHLIDVNLHLQRNAKSDSIH